MQRTMQKSEELYIENPRLDHKLCQDLINYDIIYIQASLGWGKYTFLSHFSEHHPEYTIQMLDIYNLDQQLSELPVKDGQMLLLPRYEKLQDSAASAAARGYVDRLIDPADTRKYLVAAFEMLYTKYVSEPEKKHGTK